MRFSAFVGCKKIRTLLLRQHIMTLGSETAPARRSGRRASCICLPTERRITMCGNDCNSFWWIIILIVLFMVLCNGSCGCGCGNNNNGCGCGC